MEIAEGQHPIPQQNWELYDMEKTAVKPAIYQQNIPIGKIARTRMDRMGRAVKVHPYHQEVAK